MYRLTRKKLNSKKGMTMAEVLTVIAIILILAGVAFIAVIQYQRSMGQLERDAIAKELFIAAQNHLTGANYTVTGELTEEEAGFAFGNDEDGDYYIVVNGGSVLRNDEGKECGKSMLELMLPFGAIDETIRLGGNYIIHYQPTVGKIMEVFYCSSNDKFGHTFNSAECNTLLTDYTGIEKKGDRRKYTDGSIIGWYGGYGLEELGEMIEPPKLTIDNGNKLRVISQDDNFRSDTNGIVLKLLIKGKLSGAQRCIEADANGSSLKSTSDDTEPNRDVFTLDDISCTIDTNKGGHFASRFKAGENETEFIPGEDIEVKAITYSRTMLANIAESGIKVTNSLFAGISNSDASTSSYTKNENTIIITKDRTAAVTSSNAPDTAYISCIRHLENLDKNVSNLDAFDNSSSPKLNIDKAVQIADLYWDSTDSNKHSFVKETDGKVYYSSGSGGQYEKTTNQYLSNYQPTANVTDDGCYAPVDLGEKFSYDGKNKSINEVRVNCKGDAGLFGLITSGSTIKNLELVNFNIASTDNLTLSVGGASNIVESANAGALAGAMSGGTVENVLARHDSDNNKTSVVTATGGKAGGLIGNMSNGTVRYSAAAVIVGDDNTTIAGGLIGEASNGSKVESCFSGGHTEDGEYYDKHNDSHQRLKTADPIYNVVANNVAGGLIGNAGNTEISDSYSTCSAGADTVAGGFVGSASGKITNCYCTGLVSGDLSVSKDKKVRTNDNAFIGAYENTANVSNNHYYSSVNDKAMMENGKVTSIEYKLSGITTTDSKGVVIDSAGIITPFDEKTSTFVGITDDGVEAHPYDPYLIRYYNNGSSTESKTLCYLKTVDKLKGDTTSETNKYFVAMHYGDWPAPEVIARNQ